MSACRYCFCEFEASAWQIKKSDFACKPCERKKQAEWRANRKAEGRPVVSTKMPAEYHRKYQVAYSQEPSVKARKAAQMRVYAKAHSTEAHHKARRLVRSAIDSGRLVRQPCEVCQSLPTHGHHDDYSKPLAVRWLCPKHHREHHAKATGGQA